MDLDLSSFFKTKAQAQDFSTRLSRVSDKLYETNFNLEKELTAQLGIQQRDVLLKFLSDNGISTTTSIDLKKIFEKILTEISTIQTLTLTIAVDPDEMIMKAMSDWCTQNLGKQVVFEISVDPQLIAGAMISYNGKYLDFSIRPKLQELFKSMLEQKPGPTQPKPAPLPVSGQ